MASISPRELAGEPTDLDLVRSALAADYEVLGELGRGGMAVVYRARERELDREVAVKVLPAALAFDREFVERFVREARTAAQLEHPHIVPIYRVGRAGQVIYFVMKYLRGESLASRLRRRGTLPPPEVRRVLAETALALGYAAARDVVHRDVKPDNIMLDESGQCIITDFGIARSGADTKLTATGMSLGTPRYMSPEQARAKDVDGRSDIYSLGVVGYECLTGRPPFDGTDAFAILMDHIGTPVPRPPLTSAEERELFEVIERMLAKRPEERFQSADELIAALRRGASPSRRRATAPPAGAPRVVPEGGEPSSPRPSAALDAALDAALEAGVELLRQQQPKLRAGLSVARGLVDAQRPRAAAALRASAALASRVGARVASTGPRARRALVGLLALAVGGYYAVHFTVKHRSHCPPAAEANPVAGDADTLPATATLSLLLDPIDAQRQGSDLDVYYDVCGLDRGTTFETRLTVSRQENALRKLLGGSSPVVVSLDEQASGPATRRHRSIDVGALAPGTYALDLTVTDAGGRRREKARQFQVRP